MVFSLFPWFSQCIVCSVGSSNMQKIGFVFIELMVVIAILVMLAAIAIPAFRFFQKESDLNNSVEQIINALRLAQNKTLASEGDSQWGLYFSTTSSLHQYTLFQGASYVDRQASLDEIHKLPKSVEIYEINLESGGGETVFERISGLTQQFGTVSLRLKADNTKTATVYIENSGLAGLAVPLSPSDENRIKDSRHVHFDYTRIITISTESLILTFEGSVVENIVIADNLEDGQISWEGIVSVGGDNQHIKIHTHTFNDFEEGTQFCIHRDRRYNNKALLVEISDDLTGFLIDYSADGLTTIKTSIYASDASWQ